MPEVSLSLGHHFISGVRAGCGCCQFSPIACWVVAGAFVMTAIKATDPDRINVCFPLVRSIGWLIPGKVTALN